MPVFTFSGKDGSGQKISGERTAANKQMLASQLRRERITPGAIREKGKEFSLPTFGSSKVKTKDIAIFFRQFSVMIDAGLPLLQWVVPIFANLFAGLGVTLPLPTRVVMGLSAFVGHFWWFFIIGCVGMVFGTKQIRKHPKGKYAFDKLLLNLPILGMLLRKIAVARFTRTLGTLITSGVPILEGLAITARTSGNAVLEEALMKVRKAIEEGRTIVDPLRESGVFPNMVTQMIGVGEATGAMDSMLQKIADFYEEEVDAATKDLLAMLEPAIIGMLGVCVGGIVISLYLPLFSMIAKLAG